MKRKGFIYEKLIDKNKINQAFLDVAKGGIIMRYLKGQIDTPDFTPILTDGKVYLLRYNFMEKFDEENEKKYWEYDEIVLDKNKFEYHKSIVGKQDDFITNFIANNLSKVRKVN